MIVFTSPATVRPGPQKLARHYGIGAMEFGTPGGVLGKVTAVSEHYATLQIADNVEIKIQETLAEQIAGRQLVSDVVKGNHHTAILQVRFLLL